MPACGVCPESDLFPNHFHPTIFNEVSKRYFLLPGSIASKKASTWKSREEMEPCRFWNAPPMAKTPPDLLRLPRKKQAEYLQRLTRRDLEILLFEMQSYRETFDWLNLAVYSILRDLYESEIRGASGDRAQPSSCDHGGSPKVGGRASGLLDRCFGGRPSP